MKRRCLICGIILECDHESEWEFCDCKNLCVWKNCFMSEQGPKSHEVVEEDKE